MKWSLGGLSRDYLTERRIAQFPFFVLHFYFYDFRSRDLRVNGEELTMLVERGIYFVAARSGDRWQFDTRTVLFCGFAEAKLALQSKSRLFGVISAWIRTASSIDCEKAVDFNFLNGR